MKTMNKILSGLAVLLLVSLFGVNQEVIAQDAADMEVTALVVAEITVEVEEELDFGSVVQGQPKGLLTNGDFLGSPTFTDGQIGIFNVTKSAGLSVILRFPDLPTTMAGTGDATGETLDISFTEFESDPVNFGAVVIGGTQTAFSIATEVSGITELDSVDAFDVFVGGAVDPAPDQTPGTYETEITLRVTYN